MFGKKTLTLIAGVSLLFVGSCTSSPNPEGKPLASKSFDHMAPVPLRVQTITVADIEQDIVDRWPEHFYVPADNWLQSYLTHRLNARGGPENMTIRVEEISVRYEQKDSANDVAGFLGVAKVDSYTVDIALDISLENPHDGAVRGRKFKARRVINMLERVSIAEREKKQQEGMEIMFKEMDAAIMDILRNQFFL